MASRRMWGICAFLIVYFCTIPCTFSYNDYPKHSKKTFFENDDYIDYVESRHPDIYIEERKETFMSGHSATVLKKFNNKYRIKDDYGREITEEEYREARYGKNKNKEFKK